MCLDKSPLDQSQWTLVENLNSVPSTTLGGLQPPVTLVLVGLTHSGL